MKKVIFAIISIVLVMTQGCTGNKCVKEKMIYKSKEDKVEPYLYNHAIKTFMYRNVTILKFETKDKKTIEFKTDATNQQYENLKAEEEYVVEYSGDEICSIDNNDIKEDNNER